MAEAAQKHSLILSKEIEVYEKFREKAEDTICEEQKQAETRLEAEKSAFRAAVESYENKILYTESTYEHELSTQQEKSEEAFSEMRKAYETRLNEALKNQANANARKMEKAIEEAVRDAQRHEIFMAKTSENALRNKLEDEHNLRLKSLRAEMLEGHEKLIEEVEASARAQTAAYASQYSAKEMELSQEVVHAKTFAQDLKNEYTESISAMEQKVEEISMNQSQEIRKILDYGKMQQKRILASIRIQKFFRSKRLKKNFMSFVRITQEISRMKSEKIDNAHSLEMLAIKKSCEEELRKGHAANTIQRFYRGRQSHRHLKFMLRRTLTEALVKARLQMKVSFVFF